MDKSKKFPVYQFSIKFHDKGKLKKAVYAEDMYPKEFNEEDAKTEMAYLMYSFEIEYPRISSVFTSMDFDVVGWDEWYSEYSFHFTFQLFEDEKSAFDSFRQFIKEKAEECRKSGTSTEGLKEAENEDLWRICPCDNCKQEGKTTLLHSSLYIEVIAAYQVSKTKVEEDEQNN